MKPLLEVKNLKKYFKKSHKLFRPPQYIKAVDDVSFSIGEKKTLAIVGESGSGKTTAALSAIHLIAPTEGDIFFQGENFSNASKKEILSIRKKIQMVFQDPLTSLNPRKTILESLGEPLIFHGIVKTEAEKKDRVANTLTKVGISPSTLYHYPHQFSGGERQRISIGRAVGMLPKLIVCDEAISALDLSNQTKILNLLFDLKQELGLSYLFISHDLSTVRHFSDDIVVMYKGKVVEFGPTKEVFKNPKHPYTKLLFSSLPKMHPKTQETLPIVQEERNHAPFGCPFYSKCLLAKSGCEHNLPPWKTIDQHSYNCIH